MTEKRLQDIEDRLEAATPGPWVLGADPRDIATTEGIRPRWLICRIYGGIETRDGQRVDDELPHNAALIANAPTDLRRLLDHVKALRRERDAMARYFADACNDDDRLFAARCLGRREVLDEVSALLGRVSHAAHADSDWPKERILQSLLLDVALIRDHPTGPPRLPTPEPTR